jgi:uncharacterized protein (TIGR00369 family)
MVANTDREAPVKTVADSRVRLSQFMSPNHANPQGNVHGGEIMRLADEAAALAAIRHARSHVVTVFMDSMSFMEPIFVGNLVTLDAEVTYVGTTSMETRVEVVAENPLTGVKTTTNVAYFVYVAIDSTEPHSVAPIVATTDEQRARMEAARERQAYRKQQREREREAREKRQPATDSVKDA